MEGLGLTGVWGYSPFSASYRALRAVGMRPRLLTYRPRSMAQSRISLFLGSASGVLRAWPGLLASLVTVRAALA